MKVNFLKPLTFAFCCLLSFSAHADIYEYIDEAGVTHYSDAPGNDDYVLILKSEVPVAEAAARVGRNN